jgi:hypothetical protein
MKLYRFCLQETKQYAFCMRKYVPYLSSDYSPSPAGKINPLTTFCCSEMSRD